MAEISYRRHRFPPVIIQHAVWLYLRFTLSYRDVEELLAGRGLDISYENSPVLGAEIRTGNRATATPTPSAAGQSLAPRRECAANARPAMGVRSCIEDEGRPLEAGRQGQASNYRKLRR